VYDLGIDEKEIATSMFSLYPNPAVNSVTIFNKSEKSNEGLYYEIIDLTGRTLLKGNLSGNSKETTIDLMQLPKSIYIVRLKNENSNLGELKFVRL
jgi:hypothetical protein